ILKTLFEAIETTDAGAVWKLVKEGGAAMDAVDETSELTPLAIAAEAGLAEIVRILLEAGADPNLGGATTPLEAAVVEGHLEVVEALIEKSADVNQKVEEGFTPLMTASATGNLALVQMLLDAGARPRLLNDDRESAIILAESAGHDAVVEKLKEAARRQRAANLEARQKKQAEVAEEAEQAAAAEEAAAAENREAEAATAAESREAEPEPISILVDAGSPAVDGSTELFAPTDDDTADPPALAVGDVDETASDELFALSTAIDEEEPAIASNESLDAEVDLPREVVDDFSVSLGDFKELLTRFKELADAGSDPELQQLVAENLEFADSAGRTLLMAAAYQGETGLVQALIDAGADVNACDRTDSGQTVLVYAVQSPAADRLEVVSSLVAGGADVNQRCGRNRRSALMYAVDSDVYLDRPPEPVFAQTSKELIRLGANLEARDRRGRTVWRLVKRDAIGAPTFSACRRRLHQMLRVLEYNGAQQVASHKM
ncbi:MAG: ankyrin repeat domain-containing protein, partial [Thermoanaerobaculia bacterium]